ncbi:MAG: T9SS type A sorting domain-containing protein [Ignavibacteria bacterium]
MRETILSFVIIILYSVPCFSNNNNVSEYIFSQSTGTYTSIHTTGTYITGGCTSSVFGNMPIGFTFVYNGNSYTQFGLCCSGWISLGPGTPGTSIYPLSTGSANNVISPFAAQLTSSVAGDGIYYKTEGSAPNRILTVEWWQYGFWLNGFDEICFQIKLYETSNQISFVYTTNDELSIRTVQVGLRGSSNAEFINRQTTTNWSQTTAGTTNTASCTFSPGITPPSGLTFTFSIPPVKIVNINNQIPDNFNLFQNSPNPFNPATKIKFSVPQVRRLFGGSSPRGIGGDPVLLKIYDVTGREIQTLVNESLQPGTYEITFDGSNYPSGVYFYKLSVGDYSETKRLTLLK